MKIIMKQGSDLTADEREDVAFLIRNFDTYAPAPQDGTRLIESVFDLSEEHPKNFRYFSISNHYTYFIMYDDNNRRIATATGVPSITSRKAQITIEDVYVLDKYQNQTFGTQLMDAVVHWIKNLKFYYFIQLTCSPKRGEWVNQWFVDLDFELVACPHPDKTGPHATNLYRMSLVD
jgi:GNAT superfamily N-acetyltransferase